MQMYDGINGRSIFYHLISVRSRLIVLLLCNYPEFAQGLDSRALGLWLGLCLTSSPRGPPCNLAIIPRRKHMGSVTPSHAACDMTVDEKKWI